jgi:aspartate racemase
VAVGCNQQSHKKQKEQTNHTSSKYYNFLTIHQNETAALTPKKDNDNDNKARKGNTTTHCADSQGFHHHGSPRLSFTIFSTVLCLATMIDGFEITASPPSCQHKIPLDDRRVACAGKDDCSNMPGCPLVGIVGGMGPAASLRLQELILERDRRRMLLGRHCHHGTENGFLADSRYTPFLLYNNPQIPNNNLAALGLGPPSLDELTRSAIALRKAGADVITFACTTAYAWQDQVSERAQIPVINLLDAVAERVESHGHERVGLLDVDGTHACGAFRDALGRHGIEVVLPKAKEQESVMKSVADLKAGVKPTDGPLRALETACHQLATRHDHVTAIVLGCTEIATAIGSASSINDLPPVEFFDALDILAEEITMPLENTRSIAKPLLALSGPMDMRHILPHQAGLVAA